MKKFKVKILCCLLLFVIVFNNFHISYAAYGDLFDYIYATEKNHYKTFWDQYGAYSTSGEGLKTEEFMKEALQEQHIAEDYYVSLYFLMNFINEDNVSYKKLADNNEAKYLTFSYQMIQKGIKKIDNDAKLHDLILEDGSRMSVEKFVNELLKARKKLLAAINYKGTSYVWDDDKAVWAADGKEISVKDTDTAKLEYTSGQIELYSKTFGYNGLGNSTIQSWAYSMIGDVNINDDYGKKLNYNQLQIECFIKMNGFRNNFGLENAKQFDTVLTEWHSLYIDNTHTKWYSSNERYYNQNKKYNETLDSTSRAKKISDLNIAINQKENITLDEAKELIETEGDNKYLEALIEKTSKELNAQNLANDKALYQHPDQLRDADGNYIAKGEIDADEAMQGAEDFVDAGTTEIISSTQLQDVMNPIYSIALVAGIIIAVIVGAIIGIKFMTGSVEQKAEVKKLLIPYAIGCVVIFGSFAIWKLVINIVSRI